jgi:hypothetical protein
MSNRLTTGSRGIPFPFATLLPIGTAILGVVIGKTFDVWTDAWADSFAKACLILLVLIAVLVVVDLLVSMSKIQRMNTQEKTLSDVHRQILAKLGTNAEFFRVESGQETSAAEMFTFYAELIRQARTEIRILQYRPSFDDVMWVDDHSPAYQARERYYRSLDDVIEERTKNGEFTYSRIVQLDRSDGPDGRDVRGGFRLSKYDRTCHEHMQRWIDRNSVHLSIRKAPVSLGATIIMVDRQHIIIELPNMETRLLLGVLYIEDSEMSLFPKLNNLWMHIDRRSSLVETVGEIYCAEAA